MQRFKFNSRNRQPNETVVDYVVVLRELAQHCNYGEKLQEMLRDRLVCGIEADGIQRRLLAEAELTFEKALKLAQAIETANKYTCWIYNVKIRRPRTYTLNSQHRPCSSLKQGTNGRIKSRALAATDAVVITNSRSVVFCKSSATSVVRQGILEKCAELACPPPSISLRGRGKLQATAVQHRKT